MADDVDFAYSVSTARALDVAKKYSAAQKQAHQKPKQDVKDGKDSRKT